jgi:hypothetical protein
MNVYCTQRRKLYKEENCSKHCIARQFKGEEDTPFNKWFWTTECTNTKKVVILMKYVPGYSGVLLYIGMFCISGMF